MIYMIKKKKVWYAVNVKADAEQTPDSRYD